MSRSSRIAAALPPRWQQAAADSSRPCPEGSGHEGVIARSIRLDRSRFAAGGGARPHRVRHADRRERPGSQNARRRGRAACDGEASGAGKAQTEYRRSKEAEHDTPAGKQPPARRATGQDEASCVSVENCASVLKAMVASPDRSWVHRPAAPTVLANGVRLFAYRALRPRLDCDELAAALTELETAVHTFGNPLAGLQPEQMHRVRSLSMRSEASCRTSERAAAPQQAKEGRSAPSRRRSSRPRASARDPGPRDDVTWCGRGSARPRGGTG